MSVQFVAGMFFTMLYIYPMLMRDEILSLQRSAVNGSLQKYQLTTQAITLISFVVLLKVGFIINNISVFSWPHYLAGGIWSILLLKDLLILRRLFKDSSWYSDQLEKLRSGIVAVKQNLQSILSLAPVPGFG